MDPSSRRRRICRVHPQGPRWFAAAVPSPGVRQFAVRHHLISAVPGLRSRHVQRPVSLPDQFNLPVPHCSTARDLRTVIPYCRTPRIHMLHGPGGFAQHDGSRSHLSDRVSRPGERHRPSGDPRSASFVLRVRRRCGRWHLQVLSPEVSGCRLASCGIKEWSCSAASRSCQPCCSQRYSGEFEPVRTGLSMAKPSLAVAPVYSIAPQPS